MSSILTLSLKFSRFGNDAAGLEKLLRFLQALSQIVAAYSLTVKGAAPWLHARAQFALGRRYLRFFRFIDCFNAVGGKLGAGDWNGIVLWLEVGKLSCLGMFLALESCTIMDAMGIWNTALAPKIFLESMRFWFYSLCFSLVLGFWELLQSSRSMEKAAKSKEKNSKDSPPEKVMVATRRKVLTRIVVDGCDLFTPGLSTGWLVTTPATVGWATALSSLLSSEDIWTRVQRGT